MDILNRRKPNFENLLKVLRCQKPDRPTLFEMFMNDKLYEIITGRKSPGGQDQLEYLKFLVDAFVGAGYDYVTTHASDFGFADNQRQKKETISLNENAIIYDEKTFEEFQWEDPEDYDTPKLEKIKDYLPEGAKLAVMGPGGVLENVMSLTGYDNLCYMLYENPDLLEQIFKEVGQRLVKYYEIAVQYDSVGMLISNDDWGFNTQTFLSPDAMKKYVYPWHKKIADVAHKNNKPVILHSCGYVLDVMDDIVHTLQYDGKHSYEDNIMSVEDFYDKWKGQIAVLGGIDVNFLINSSVEDIRKRSRAMIERSLDSGGYALGTGNSVPVYIPVEKYFAMISVIHDDY
ncbi:MAG: uroporphyrinogen decarboxylase family protein [Caldicoprobacterales bacterium]